LKSNSEPQRQHSRKKTVIIRHSIGFWIALAILVAACNPTGTTPSSTTPPGTATPTTAPLLSGPATFQLDDRIIRPNGDCLPGGVDITGQSASGTFTLTFISSTGVITDGIEGLLAAGTYAGTVTPVIRSGVGVGQCGTTLPSFSIGSGFTSIAYRAFFDQSNPVCIFTSQVTITGLAISGLSAVDAVLQPLIEAGIRDDLHRGIDRDVAERLNRVFNNNQPLPQGNTGRCADWELLTN
jgi:hypothetical protein